jgi:Fe-S cluster biosynthesis and repair protein YggX
MAQIECARCGESGEQVAAPPLPTDLGNRIYDSICQSCWDEWLQQQKVVINHYRLDLRQPEARTMLTQQTEAFLFGPPPE